MQPERYCQIKTLFQHVLALPPEARDSFLGSASANDPELLDAVRALLTADGDAASFLEEPVVGSTFRMSARLAASSIGP